MIIGISGKAGVGKDTLADRLVTEHGFVKVSLADPMKRFCREVFGFSYEQLWGPSAKRNKLDLRLPKPGTDNAYLTPRHALQTLGTEWGRECYEDVWIDYAIRTAERLLQEQHTYYSSERGIYRDRQASRIINGVVIPDIRFGNELRAIQNGGGKTILLCRTGAGLSGKYGAHVSEHALNGPFDAIYHNESTVADLHRFGDQCVQDFS